MNSTFIIAGRDSTRGPHQGQDRFYVAQTPSGVVELARIGARWNLTLGRDGARRFTQADAEQALPRVQRAFPPATDWHILEA